MVMTCVARCTNLQATPEDWRVFSLQELATLERGKFSARPRNDPRYFGGPYPFIQTGDVTNSHGTVTSYSQTLNEYGLRVSRLFPPNTLFFTIAANIGDVAVAPFATACPDSLIAISPNSRTDQSWLFYALGSRKRIFESLATQNAQLNINLEKLRPYELAVPPLPEQQAIAAALSDVDALLGALDRLIAKKRDLKQAAMQQLLTGQTRLPGFSGKWDSKPLASVLSTGRLGGNYPNQDTETEYPLIKMGNIGRGDIDVSVIEYMAPGVTPDQEHRLREGDVLFNTRNTLDLVGKVGIWRDELPVAYFNSNLMRLEFKPEQVCNEFANYALNTWSAVAQLRALATGTTSVAAIYTRDLMRMAFAMPPMEEQRVIAKVLSDMEMELRVLGQQRDKTRLLKQGMMQELLTGKTRLV